MQVSPVQQSQCPECDGQVQFTESETICSDCGLIIDDAQIDHGPEWRHFHNDQSNPKRTGAPLTQTRHDRGLSTDIGHSSEFPSQARRQQLSRMRTQQSRAQFSSKSDRNRAYAFGEIDRLTSALELPESATESACKLFTSAQKNDLMHGRSLEGFATACTYVAARTADIARTITEVCEPAKATRDEFRAAFDAMNQELGLPIAPASPVEYLPRFASELDLDADVERQARNLADKAVETGIACGRHPGGVAAACLYTAGAQQNLELTQAAVAKVADVTPTTIRTTYQKLTE